MPFKITKHQIYEGDTSRPSTWDIMWEVDGKDDKSKGESYYFMGMPFSDLTELRDALNKLEI